jgi:hypothetical protein
VSESGVVRISGRAVDADQIAEIRRTAGKTTDINKLNLDQLKLKTPD